MAQTLDELVTFFEADLTGLEAGVRRGSRAVDAFVRDTADSLRRGGAAMRRAGVRMSAAITLPIIAGGAALVKLASDAEETRNKFNVTFRGIGDAARQASQVLQDEFIMSGIESERLLSNTGDLLVGFGFAADSALELSLEVQKLSADLASFQNLEGGAAQASDALTKALLGERESAKLLGIVINENLVKQEIATLALEGMTFETEQQAKAQATMRIALRQSKNAIGDLDRSADSFANQVRALKRDLTNLGVEMGRTLLPIARDLLGGIREVTKMLEGMTPETRRNVVMMAVFAAAVGPVLIVLSAFLTTAGLLLAVLKATIVIGIALAGSITGLIAPILLVTAVAVGLFFALKDIEQVGPLLKSVRDFLKKVFSAVAEDFSSLIDFLRADTDTLTSNMSKALVFLADGARLVGLVWHGLAIVISGAAQLMLLAITGLTAGLAELARFLGSDKFADVLDVGGKALGGAIDGLTEGIDASLVKIDELIDNIGEVPEGLKGAAAPVFDFFAELPNIIGLAKTSIEDFLFTAGQVEMPQIPAADAPDVGPMGMESFVEGLEKFTKVGQTIRSETELMALSMGEAVKTAGGSMIDGFSNAFTGVLMGTKSFGQSMKQVLAQSLNQLVSMMIKSVLERVFLSKIETVANATAAAPHPFLIPLFVSIAVAAFGAALSGVGGSSFDQSGGGGAGSSAAGAMATAQPNMSGFGGASDVIRSIDEGGDAEGGAPNRIVVELNDDQGRNLMAWTTEQVRNGQGDGVDRLALRSEVG